MTQHFGTCYCVPAEFMGTKRGIKIGEKLLAIEPFTASSYVMLYNLYMDAGKISFAMRTRGLMRERGMTKETGISWAEFGGSIHHFTDGDNSCSQKNEIVTRLEELLVRVKQKTEHGGTSVWELGFQSKRLVRVQSANMVNC